MSDLEKKTEVKDNDIAMYFAHSAEFSRDTSFRFNDLFPLEIHIEKELVSLQNDEDLKQKFKTSYKAFWMQAAIPERYLALWIDIKLFFSIAFSTSHLVAVSSQNKETNSA